MSSAVRDNTERHRFELEEEGATAFADYRRQGDRLLITHVEAPAELRGKGTAGRLMEGALAAIRAEGIKVTPLCGYAAAYMRRNPQHQDLLA